MCTWGVIGNTVGFFLIILFCLLPFTYFLSFLLFLFFEKIPNKNGIGTIEGHVCESQSTNFSLWCVFGSVYATPSYYIAVCF